MMEKLNLNIGDNVKVEIKKEIPKYNLEDLITKMPNDYKAKEETTMPVGKEEW